VSGSIGDGGDAESTAGSIRLQRPNEEEEAKKLREEKCSTSEEIFADGSSRAPPRASGCTVLIGAILVAIGGGVVLAFA
jgi:hypothetical protein